MFSTSVETLLKHLNRVQGPVEKSNVRPILSNFLLSLKGSQLEVIASGNDMQITERVEVKPGKGIKEQSTTVNAQKLLSTLRYADPEGEVHLILESTNAKVYVGDTNYVLQTMPATDYPLPDASAEKRVCKADVDGNELRRVLHHVQFSMASGNHRYYLNGMLWSLREGELHVVATNGHRLAFDVAPTVNGEGTCEAIIPRQTVIELHKLISGVSDDVQIELYGNSSNEEVGQPGSVRITLGSTVIHSQLINAKFPNHEQVIPKKNENLVVISRALLKSALRRTMAIAENKDQSVALVFESDTIKLSHSSLGGEKADNQISLVSHDGSQVDMNLGSVYLEEVLDTLECDEVVFALKDSQSSVMIVPSGENPTFKYVVMPIRS